MIPSRWAVAAPRHGRLHTHSLDITGISHVINTLPTSPTSTCARIGQTGRIARSAITSVSQSSGRKTRRSRSTSVSSPPRVKGAQWRAQSSPPAPHVSGWPYWPRRRPRQADPRSRPSDGSSHDIVHGSPPRPRRRVGSERADARALLVRRVPESRLRASSTASTARRSTPTAPARPREADTLPRRRHANHAPARVFRS